MFCWVIYFFFVVYGVVIVKKKRRIKNGGLKGTGRDEKESGARLEQK